MHTNSINYMNIFNCRIIPAIIIIIISKRLKRERENYNHFLIIATMCGTTTSIDG